MRDLIILLVHFIATLAPLLGPSGIRSVVAESVLIQQQLLILKSVPSAGTQSTGASVTNCC